MGIECFDNLGMGQPDACGNWCSGFVSLNPLTVDMSITGDAGGTPMIPTCAGASNPRK